MIPGQGTILTECNKDRVAEQEKAATERFMRAIDNWDEYRQSLAVGTPSSHATPERIDERKELLDPGDSLALERVMGRSDLFPISFLEMGKRVSRSVCRIEVRDAIGRVLWYGTGFLVSPTLLLTNNHILETTEHAKYSLAQFDYENDLNQYPLPVKSFRLAPERFFETDRTLDFALVAVEPRSQDGTTLDGFGYLPLVGQTGKIMKGEYVSIVQHPGGAPKAVAVRENQMIGVKESFLHYLTDTQPGSSGSPVFSDDWRVVALHHAGVQDPNDPMNYIANEGVRVSAILAALASRKEAMKPGQARLLDELLAAFGQVPAVPVPAVPSGMTLGALAAEWYEGSTGYDPAFLGGEHVIPLPALSAAQEEDVATPADGSRDLKYTHFSVVMSRSRRLAFFTAVNIDGSRLQSIGRDTDKWYFDPRIDRSLQCGPDLYEKNDLDQGHLVRRIDPVWGDNAYEANEDTFHFTNCSPQHKKLNRISWLRLEDYILQNAGNYGLRVSVFTGPVFREDDLVYKGEFRIPAEFWKVVAMVKDDGTLSATAYLQTQKNLISDLEFAYGEYKTYQVPVATIKGLTGVDFGDLARYDPLARIEGTSGRLVEGPGDIRL
ncbi:endonuclease G [Methanolinea mesophila]|uniref:DNA/RNA non-specific endonuclease n=1 Tax=Methanolinea mesophila TaxID=547055 RepID=UPI001AE933FD|nr:DNA/RNA non-specific endonuclease [Methanolinea mesophila]MBP1928978.1 endonuclease G [Methanolinea mesophila]